MEYLSNTLGIQGTSILAVGSITELGCIKLKLHMAGIDYFSILINGVIIALAFSLHASMKILLMQYIMYLVHLIFLTI